MQQEGRAILGTSIHAAPVALEIDVGLLHGGVLVIGFQFKVGTHDQAVVQRGFTGEVNLAVLQPADVIGFGAAGAVFVLVKVADVAFEVATELEVDAVNGRVGRGGGQQRTGGGCGEKEFFHGNGSPFWLIGMG